MPERFGEVLRKARREAGRTLRDIANVLGVSVVYVSDVERSNRRPFSNERILKIARYLNTDAGVLIAAANSEKGFIEYDITRASPLEANVVGGLVSGLARGGVTDDQLHKIKAILGEDDQGV